MHGRPQHIRYLRISVGSDSPKIGKLSLTLPFSVGPISLNPTLNLAKYSKSWVTKGSLTCENRQWRFSHLFECYALAIILIFLPYQASHCHSGILTLLTLAHFALEKTDKATQNNMYVLSKNKHKLFIVKTLNLPSKEWRSEWRLRSVCPSGTGPKFNRQKIQGLEKNWQLWNCLAYKLISSIKET